MNMNGTVSIKQDNQISSKSSANFLKDKVVLIIGNNERTLYSLAVQFATLGGEIVLLSPQLPGGVTESIHRKVMQDGGRSFVVDSRLVTDARKAKTLVDLVKREVGKIDILIDMSAARIEDQRLEAYLNISQPKWWLSSIILHELIS